MEAKIINNLEMKNNLKMKDQSDPFNIKLVIIACAGALTLTGCESSGDFAQFSNVMGTAAGMSSGSTAQTYGIIAQQSAIAGEQQQQLENQQQQQIQTGAQSQSAEQEVSSNPSVTRWGDFVTILNENGTISTMTEAQYQEKQQTMSQKIDSYRKTAQQGDAFSQCELGKIYCAGYSDGSGVDKDYGQAAYWFRKAAAQGYAEAQFRLGSFHYAGFGVEKDYSQALDWFRKAAAQGFIKAQNNLGMMYLYGQGTEKDFKQALDWFLKASSYDNAQFSVGLIYENGWGVPKDIAQAKEWYQKAAAQGNKDAQQNLARLNQAPPATQ